MTRSIDVQRGSRLPMILAKLRTDTDTVINAHVGNHWPFSPTELNEESAVSAQFSET
jgi:hypothetical protein